MIIPDSGDGNFKSAFNASELKGKELIIPDSGDGNSVVTIL